MSLIDRYYTGIGTRKTTPAVFQLLVNYGKVLATLGYVLRSGGADGADRAFEQGCDFAEGIKEIYLPWKHFNNHPSQLFVIPPEALVVAKDIYGDDWDAAKSTTHKFMARNCQQVMGMNLDTPSTFVICYTSDGCESFQTRTKDTGGTGQAVAYASILGIPVFNLGNEDGEHRLQEFLASIA